MLILAILAGCNHPRAGVIPPAIAPAGKTGQPLPYEHPAAEKVRKIFETLDVTSEGRYRELPKRDRYVWDVRWFETEAMNGGLDQFLWNTTGDHTQETLEALKAIGATESHAALLAATFAGWVVVMWTMPWARRICFVRWLAAARNTIGAEEWEYSSRKWCSTSQA